MISRLIVRVLSCAELLTRRCAWTRLGRHDGACDGTLSTPIFGKSDVADVLAQVFGVLEGPLVVRHLLRALRLHVAREGVVQDALGLLAAEDLVLDAVVREVGDLGLALALDLPRSWSMENVRLSQEPTCTPRMAGDRCQGAWTSCTTTLPFSGAPV
jgi:hypothetical protein